MKLIHTDVNGDKHEVSIGFRFGHGPDEMIVCYMPEPHKPSSSGKVSVSNVLEPDMQAECFASVWDMKWIEREDQGWIHPEVELGNILEMYEELYDDDISGLDLVSVIDMVSQVDMDHLKDCPSYALPILEWLNKQ